MQTHSYGLEEMAQSDAVLTISNTVVMAQLAQITFTMNTMQAQLKALSTATTNQTRSKRKYYCWSYGSNYTHSSKTYSSKKAGHQYEAYYKEILVEIEKGCE